MAAISLLVSLAWIIITFKTVVSREKLFMPPQLTGRALSNHILLSFDSSEFSDCILRCEEEEPCLSVNFREDLKICEMNNARRSDDVINFITDPASKYAQLDTESKTIHGACNFTPCGSEGICMPDCGETGYSCLCRRGWTGDSCQYPPAAKSVQPPITNSQTTVPERSSDSITTTPETRANPTSSSRPSTISTTTSASSTISTTTKLMETTPNPSTKKHTTPTEPIVTYAGVYSECYYKPNGEDYRGRVSVTKKGIPCQAWSSDVPHPRAKTYFDIYYTVAGLDHNYCRNPDKYDTPWCFTTDPDPQNEWDICTIQNCSSID